MQKGCRAAARRIQKSELLSQFRYCEIEGKIEEEEREGDKEDVVERDDEGEVLIRA